MSKVRYINYANDIYYDPKEYTCNGYNLFTPFVHKRTAFAHESELRLFHQIESAVDNLEYWKNQPNDVGQNLPCDLKKLIEKIILPPTADDTVREKVRDLLLKYNINVVIEKSKLNDDPNY